MAHVQKRSVRTKKTADGRTAYGKRTVYVARYRDPGGRERSKRFTRKVDADNFVTDQENAKLRDSWIDPDRGKIPLADWSARWLRTMPHLKPTTRRNYEILLDQHVLPRFGTYALRSFEAIEVREWAADLSVSLSASWARQAVRLLRTIMDAAIADERIVRNPCVGVKLPRLPQTEQRFLTAEQVEALADAAGPYRVLILVLAWGGLRWGEAAALRRKRCDLLHARLDVAEGVTEIDGKRHYGETKTYERRWVALPPSVRDDLAVHLAGVPRTRDALVFTAARGGPLRHNNFSRRVWPRALKAAGIPAGLRIQDLRHTCASLWIREVGANPKAVQNQLGHRSAVMTWDRYGHLYPDDVAALAEALDRSRREAVAAVRQSATGAPENRKLRTVSE